MSRRQRIIVLCAIGTAGAIAAGAGCGDSDEPSEPARAATTALTVATIPTDTSAQAFYAADHGDFDRERLDVKVTIQADPSQLAAAVLGGDAQIVLTSTAGLVLLRSRKAPVRMVAAGAVYDPDAPTTTLVAGRGSEVRSVADLAGRTVAVDSLNSPPHIALVRSLQEGGVSPRRVRFAEIPFAQMLQPLGRGDVDAAVLPEPFLTIALSEGAARVANIFDAVCPRPCLLTAWIAREDWIAGHRDAVARFRRAIESASRWANDDANHEATAAVLSRFAPIDPAIAGRMVRASFSERLEPGLARPWIDTFAGAGVIPEPFPAEELTGQGP